MRIPGPQPPPARRGTMTPQRRVALASVAAACALVTLKLVAGLVSGSLGLISEAAHSGTDLVAALLAFFSLGVAARPADQSHAYGHGKAENLSALAEGGLLVAVSLVIAAEAVRRLITGSGEVDTSWWVFAVAGLVVVIDAARTATSWTAARRYRSPALAGSAIHFASDLVGTLAVLVGLVLVKAGFPAGDPVAALFVSALVLVAAGRLMRTNVDVLMDRVPDAAEAAARDAVAGLAPVVELRRLRMRDAAGQHFVDVVVGVAPGSTVGQAHAAADAVEASIERALPGSDVVVHVEPAESGDVALGERVLAAAQRVDRVREIHNVSLLRMPGGVEASLHLKLPAGTPLAEAHELASQVERAVREDVPEVALVNTHLEPLGEPGDGRRVPGPAADEALGRVADAVRRAGAEPREVRLVRTDAGLVAYVTVGLGAGTALADAHARAGAVRDRVRREAPEVIDAFVHTEP